MRRLAAALAVGLFAAAAPAAPAGASAAQRHACSMNVPVTHTPDQVQAHLKQTCGDRVRGWGDWAGKWRYGTYLLHGYSTACDNPGSCQGHPDGSLRKGGWQDRRTGAQHCTFGCGIHTTAAAVVVLDAATAGGGGHGAMIARDHPGAVTVPAPPGASRACTQGGIGYTINQFAPSSIVSWWSSNGCAQYQSPKLQDNGGGIHYGDSWRTAVNVTSLAGSPNAADQGEMWLRYKNTSGGQHYCFRVWKTRGTTWVACDN